MESFTETKAITCKEVLDKIIMRNIQKLDDAEIQFLEAVKGRIGYMEYRPLGSINESFMKYFTSESEVKTE